MCAYDDENVHALALRGACFDDCQKIVKGLFADQQFHARHSLGAVNSINWARIVAQIVYYFYASFQVDQAPVFSCRRAISATSWQAGTRRRWAALVEVSWWPRTPMIS